MKKYLFTCLLIIIASIGVPAQKIAKPTLTPKEITSEQRARIEEGIKLHDQQQYEAAIKKYEGVLAENPDSTLALYELTFSLYKKGDKEKAIETAVKGAKYTSPELPMFYVMIANVIDDYGKPDEAIKIYKDAISILKDDKSLNRYLSAIHFNLGVTYIRQKKHAEARESLKQSSEYDPSYPSPHYLLSEVFSSSKYRVPAFLAAARFISLEYNTQRTNRAAAIVKSTLEPAKKDEKTGNINIFIDMTAPKDEGDFAMFDLFLGTMMTVKSDKDKDKTLEEVFADAVDSVIALVAEDKKLTSTFVGKNYIPFVAEMKQNGYSRPFSYIVLYKTGNPNAEKWLTANSAKMVEFLNWAKTYKPRGK